MYKVGKDNMDNLDIQRPKIELRSRNKVKFKNKFTKIVKVQNGPLYYIGEFSYGTNYQ